MPAPDPIAPSTVAFMLCRFGGNLHDRRRYPIVSSGIARAANEDPLFPDMRSGCQATACILVANAFIASRIKPFLRVGRRLGLYQIRPPLEPKVRAASLFQPFPASLIAIDLIRESARRTAELPWDQRLAWYLDLGSRDGVVGHALVLRPETLTKSGTIMTLARSIYRSRYKEDLHFEPTSPPLLEAAS